MHATNEPNATERPGGDTSGLIVPLGGPQANRDQAVQAGTATSETATSATAKPETAKPASNPEKSRDPEQSFDRSIGELLTRLQEAIEDAPVSASQQSNRRVESRLAIVRLGVATSLFYSLQCKHAPTASHGLRVALLCSGWAESLGLDDRLRDQIEVAALLHDVGKIGIPDRILRKPGKLNVNEQLAMDACPEMSCAILKGSTSDTGLLEIVRYGNVWFNSRRDDATLRGKSLPQGARMLAIADAFDSMTTDHVYRVAMSADRAVAELVSGSGTQFDPELVSDFSRWLERRPEVIHGNTVNRWLQKLRPNDPQSFWTGKLVHSASIAEPPSPLTQRRETIFHQRLLQTLKDGVAFTDSEGVVTEWNLTMERLTGIPAEAMVGKQWSPHALRMRDADAKPDEEVQCPMQRCLQEGCSVRRAMLIEVPGAKPISVHVEVTPAVGERPGNVGTVVIVNDLSDRESLEQRLETLHEKSTRDPLTGVANRAHFDQTLEELVDRTSQGGQTFSLVICDIDHFKRINDTYGHPAGDEALKTFANLLQSHSREGDLVARYGGEEFLLVAVNCDNATGAKRAEVIRRSLQETPMKSLGGEPMTASFGVTEFQSGDDAATLLARADRALLKAKDNGRNRVVQLGLGKMSEVAETPTPVGWFGWLSSGESKSSTTADILTPVPIDLAIEKLRGFIADHHAQIVEVKENQLTLKVVSGANPGGRRRADRQITFIANLTLSEAQPDELPTEKSRPGGSTKVHLELKPIRNRDRRRRELKGAAHRLVLSFRCYLMGEILPDPSSRR
ncbi:sensor domain-containing diguanylate cyclase/phosphohydrolase [Roseiconus nitratireducens]|nr:diguanylate cyclase [Roseiconus nitratireducens]